MPNLNIDTGRVALLQSEYRRSDSVESAPASMPAHAPVRLTPPRRLTEVAGHIAQKEQESGNDHSKISRNATDAQQEIRRNQIEARKVGVDTTRKSFLGKALGIGTGILSLATSIVVAIASGGGSAIAAGVVTGVMFLVSAADARCAYMNHKNAIARREGKALPYGELPMGDSSIGNLLHKLFTVAGFGPEWAKTLATICDRALRIGLSVALAVCTMGASAAIDSFARVSPLVGGAINLVQTIGSAKHDWSSSRKYEHSKEAINENFDIMERVVNDCDMDAGERSGLLEDIKKGRQECLEDLKDGEAHIPRKFASVSGAGLSLSVVGSGLGAVALAALSPGGVPADPSVTLRLEFGTTSGASIMSTGLGGLRQPPEREPPPETQL